jgi:hypothetical protein
VRTGTDHAVRRAGIAVFALGVLLLLAVFFLAYGGLIASGPLTATPSAPAPSTPRSGGDLAMLVATKGLFLFLMGFVSSAIANKGIGLYQAAVHAEEDL